VGREEEEEEEEEEEGRAKIPMHLWENKDMCQHFFSQNSGLRLGHAHVHGRTSSEPTDPFSGDSATLQRCRANIEGSALGLELLLTSS
jgi:hypothetical protein